MQKGRSQQLEDTLFREIIEVNLGRILSRLRSRHATKTIRNVEKPPIVSQLSEAMKEIRRHLSKKPQLVGDFNKIEKFVGQMRELFRLLENKKTSDVTAGKCSETVRELVQICNIVSSRFALGEFFSSFPNSNSLGPTQKDSLPRNIGKIGRYRSSSIFLHDAARKLQEFREIRVESVGSSISCGLRNLRQFQPQSLGSTLDRIMVKKREGNSPAQTQIIQAVSTNLTTNQQFTKLAKRSDEHKVHAEIQLLLFYEMQNTETLPRVIASSKSACFLCDLFIKNHGQFYIQQTHGILYSKWALPDLQAIGIREPALGAIIAIIEQINNDLEGKIRDQLPKAKLQINYFNESALNIPGNWSPSAASLSHRSSTELNSVQRDQHDLDIIPKNNTGLPKEARKTFFFSSISEGKIQESPAVLAQKSGQEKTRENDASTAMHMREDGSEKRLETTEGAINGILLPQAHIADPMDQTVAMKGTNSTTLSPDAPKMLMRSRSPGRSSSILWAHRLSGKGDCFRQTIASDHFSVEVKVGPMSFFLSSTSNAKSSAAKDGTKQARDCRQPQSSLLVHWLDVEELSDEAVEANGAFVNLDDLKEGEDVVFENEGEGAFGLRVRYRSNEVLIYLAQDQYQ